MLRGWRIRAGYQRQVDAAITLGCVQGQVAAYETGARCPSVAMLRRWADVYGLTDAEVGAYVRACAVLA